MMKRWLPRLPWSSWQSIRAAHIVAAALCLGFATYSGPGWVATVDSFIGGYNIASAVYCSYAIRMQHSFDLMRVAFDEMARINAHLIAGEIATHFMEQESANGDDRPIASSRLH